MQFVKKYLCVRSVRWAVLSTLFIFLECSVYAGEVTAFDPPSDTSATRDAESDVDKAKNWVLQDLEGKEFKLGQFKGKVIFINIWATWCTPCVFEMQSIQKLYDTFKDEDVVFLIVSNEEKDTVQRFYKQKKYTFPVYLTHPLLPQQFRSPGIPSTFIIDRKGGITLRHMGVADWNQQSCRDFIRGLLSNPDGSKIAKPFADSGDYLELIKEKQRNYIRTVITSRLQPFMEQNNLPPEVRSKLIDIRVEELLKTAETDSGNISTPDRLFEKNRIQKESDEKISRLLPEKIYEAYNSYKKFEEQWAILSQINKELKYHGIEIEKVAAQQLVAAMYNDTQELMNIQMKAIQQGELSEPQSKEEMVKKVLEYQKMLTGMYIDSAKEILTEPQLNQFKRYFDNQITSFEKTLMERVQ